MEATASKELASPASCRQWRIAAAAAAAIRQCVSNTCMACSFRALYWCIRQYPIVLWHGGM